LSYLDVSVEQILICNVDAKKFGASSSSEYDWTLFETNSTANILTTFNSTKYKTNGKILTINKNFLLANKNYTFTCVVSGLVNCGSVS
jgi:hypothetical protein